MATFSIAALQTELTGDPKQLGYAPLRSPSPNYLALAAKLNGTYATVGTVWRTDLSAAEMLACLVESEVGAMTVLQWTRVMVLLSPGIVDASQQRIRDMFAGIFAGAPFATSRANLIAAAAKASPSRAEELWGYGVRVSEQNIAEALSS